MPLQFASHGGICFQSDICGKFALIGENGLAYVATADESGWVTFHMVAPGSYRLHKQGRNPVLGHLYMIIVDAEQIHLQF